MDSDGQHPADLIPEFMAASLAAPDAMVLGRPVFDASAPLLRVQGRALELVDQPRDARRRHRRFALRLSRLPGGDLVAVMRGQPWMRRFDFDPEAVVRLAWRGLRPVNIAAPVKYLRPEEGGVSHFRYVRDNILLTWMHCASWPAFLLRLPSLSPAPGRPAALRRFRLTGLDCLP